MVIVRAMKIRLENKHGGTTIASWASNCFSTGSCPSCRSRIEDTSLLTQVSAKIRKDKALVLLIAPVWTTQNWYPLLLQLAVEQPILLPRKDNLLTLPHSQELHPLKDSLRLAAWILSGDRLQTEAFLMMQSQSSVHLGPLGLINSTTQPGRNGVAGARKGKLIYFRYLSMK